MMRRTLAGCVAAGCLAIAACGGDPVDDMDDVRGEELVEFSSACVDSPDVGNFEGSTKWAPQSQWKAKASEQAGWAQGWIDAPREGHRYTVECSLSNEDGTWGVDSVKVEPVEYSRDDLTDVEVEAMKAAYGEDFDPNEIVRLRGICDFLMGKDALYGEADGAKILCPDNDYI